MINASAKLKSATAKDYPSLRKGHRIGVQSVIDYFARLFVPIVIIIFNIYYWGSAIKEGGIEI